MRMPNRLFVFSCLFIFLAFTGNGQTKRSVSVIGSSTSAEYFAGQFPKDSGYVHKLEKYWKDLDLIDTVYKYGVNSTDCYTGMPTGYVPPEGRNQPNPNINITKALDHTPRPEVVIVNYPSNNYGTLSDEEIIFCLDSIKKYANERGVECYITSSQPRDDYWSYNGDVCRLLQVRDLILDYFGEYAIDFYTGLAADDCKRKEEYALAGDFYHLNPVGHTVLMERVLDKNIIKRVVAINFSSFHAIVSDQSIVLKWQVEDYGSVDNFIVERSSNGKDFEEIAIIPSGIRSDYQYTDDDVVDAKYYYRVVARERTGSLSYTDVVSVSGSFAAMRIGRISGNGNQLSIEILGISGSPGILRLFDMYGRLVFSRRASISNGFLRVSHNHLPAGAYAIEIAAGHEKVHKIISIRD